MRACGWDDFFLVLVVISLSVGTIGICIATDNGLGQHLLYLAPKEIADYMRIFYVCNGTLPISTCTIKIAILLQYLRIFERGTKTRTFTIVVLVITTLWGIAYTFLAWVPCIPVAAYWDWTIPSQARWGFGSQTAERLIWTYAIHGTTNMVLDFTIYAIPLPLYLNNKANEKSRKSVLCLFLLGTVVLMLTTWRFVEILKSRAGTYPTLDITWYTPLPMTLAILEIDVAAICASLPVFWPVLQISMGAIFVTREVEITTETVDTHAEDDKCLEMAAPHALCQQTSATRLDSTAGLFDPETHGANALAQTTPDPSPEKGAAIIFGAYMKGKTTCDVEALRAG
ncbi:hypothetical protein CGRA01v4_14058 [Colletotrichum graminicola]|uniref:Rhodopsin domain-containing protein n=1 Tax=Colletotrichum graminicola (strain M1.001 / M2 / FGSC 10212) TaxID=645133 RepID=E3QUT3_COLGM|nr:uncharacterized protein GLRG_09765 [Colletotrichum graminicola M1.001]EFQ34621.1 hypothetical protein GLRG_09765 [Colletotrichum graminicola M1.001]WDK22768.1 hypothetical protein CGRA01v4_14058 [Colletotrichum graminicola]